MKVTFPKCKWCQTPGAYKCKRCGEWTCNSCLVEITDADRCVHKAYIEAESADWTWEELDQMMRNATDR